MAKTVSMVDDVKEAKQGNMDIRDVTVDNRKLRIYLDGVFDMTHFGHYRLFKSVKEKFPNSIIIVGVSGDEETIRLKGQTLMNESERTESVSHCKWVDKVICPCPWIVNQQFLDKHNIDYVAHDGAPYVSANSCDIYDFVKAQGKFIATQRTKGISTTGLINRIIVRYNEFVLRNLKRGVKRKELGVSWAREKSLKLGHSMDKTTENVKKWMDNPQSFIDDFLTVFDRQRKKLLNRVEREKEQIMEEGSLVAWTLKYSVVTIIGSTALYVISRNVTQKYSNKGE